MKRYKRHRHQPQHIYYPKKRRLPRLRHALIAASLIATGLVIGVLHGNQIASFFTGDGEVSSTPATEVPATVVPTTEVPVIEAPTLPSSPSWGNVVPSIEIQKEAFKLVNEARREEGLKTLTLDPLLQGLARQHCLDIKELGYPPHTGFQERAAAISAARGSSWIAENVGIGYGSPEILVNGWLNSPPHRSNMLDPRVEWAGLAYIDGVACLIVCD